MYYPNARTLEYRLTPEDRRTWGIIPISNRKGSGRRRHIMSRRRGCGLSTKEFHRMWGISTGPHMLTPAEQKRAMDASAAYKRRTGTGRFRFRRGLTVRKRPFHTTIVDKSDRRYRKRRGVRNLGMRGGYGRRRRKGRGIFDYMITGARKGFAFLRPYLQKSAQRLAPMAIEKGTELLASRLAVKKGGLSGKAGKSQAKALARKVAAAVVAARNAPAPAAPPVTPPKAAPRPPPMAAPPVAKPRMSLARSGNGRRRRTYYSLRGRGHVRRRRRRRCC